MSPTHHHRFLPPRKNFSKVCACLCDFFVKLLHDDVVCGCATHQWPNRPHWRNFDGGAQPPSSPLRLQWQRMERQVFFFLQFFFYFYILIKHASDGRENHPSPGRDHWRRLGFQRQGTANLVLSTKSKAYTGKNSHLTWNLDLY